MKADEFRGRQITIGTLAFHMPIDRPETDNEIIEREELIADIEAAIRPHREVAKLGADLQKELRNDITITMASRRGLVDEGAPLFECQGAGS